MGSLPIIYQNLGITNLPAISALKDSTSRHTFVIEKAGLLRYEDTKELRLSLRKKSADEASSKCDYRLVGEVQEIFRSRMKARRIGDLIGREIWGYVCPERQVLQGISVKSRSGK